MEAFYDGRNEENQGGVDDEGEKPESQDVDGQSDKNEDRPKECVDDAEKEGNPQGGPKTREHNSGYHRRSQRDGHRHHQPLEKYMHILPQDPLIKINDNDSSQTDGRHSHSSLASGSARITNTISIINTHAQEIGM
jgi:hypothetical protein